MQQTNTNNNEALIAENEKWFNFWIIVPKITTILLAVASFVLGIELADLTGISIVIFLVGGAVFCALNYAILKLVMSYKILHICYLKKIALNTGNDASKSSAINKSNELPKI